MLVDASCSLEYSDVRQHCVENECMSFIREPCSDGTECYNNMGKTSFGTTCVQNVCKVLTGNMCNHEVDCANESDKCIDKKCTATKCNCKSYEECVDYECARKQCSSTPDCMLEGHTDASFCFDNFCHPLSSFGGKCGVTSDCGEASASCINGICAIAGKVTKTEKTSTSSFGNGFITGFLIASFIGFAIYTGSKTNCICECFHNIIHKIGYGEVAVVEGEIIPDNEASHGKQIQLSTIL